MRKRVIATILSMALLISWTGTAKADEYTSDYGPFTKPFLIESTAYCYGEITKDGSKVREGIAAAKEEWLGLTAILYDVEPDGSIGAMRGIYEIKDTGSDYRLKNGTCIDIYIPDEQEAKEYGRQQVYIQLVDAKG